MDRVKERLNAVLSAGRAVLESFSNKQVGEQSRLLRQAKNEHDSSPTTAMMSVSNAITHHYSVSQRRQPPITGTAIRIIYL